MPKFTFKMRVDESWETLGSLHIPGDALIIADEIIILREDNEMEERDGSGSYSVGDPHGSVSAIQAHTHQARSLPGDRQ